MGSAERGDEEAGLERDHDRRTAEVLRKVARSAPQDLLVALIAPRALLLQTGDTDYWSDPKGEFLAAISARPVFELFGKRGPATDAFPPAGQLVGDTLAYYMHAGGHGMVPGDWAVYLDFLEQQFERTGPGRSR